MLYLLARAAVQQCHEDAPGPSTGALPFACHANVPPPYCSLQMYHVLHAYCTLYCIACVQCTIIILTTHPPTVACRPTTHRVPKIPTSNLCALRNPVQDLPCQLGVRTTTYYLPLRTSIAQALYKHYFT